MKKAILLGALALAMGAAQAAAPFAAWTKWREISVNTSNTAGGANVATAQTNFPVLVRLTPGSDATGGNVLTEALTGGADIRFTDSSGTMELPYEIESWSTTAGAAIWVRVPSVAANASTKLRIYWGRTGAGSASNSKAVFGGNNFIGVWHLGNASGAAARPNAANPGVNNAVPAGSATASMNPVAGLIGMADSMRSQDADQDASDHMNLGSITFPQAQMTTSMWINLPDPQNFVAWTHFFTHGNSNLEDNIWMGRENNTTNLRARSATGGAESGNAANTTITGGIAALHTWIHIGVTKDSTEGRRWRVYKDGTPTTYYGAADNHIFVANTRSSNYIARSLWPDRNAHVKVDEMRTSSIARSPEWMKLEYETQKPGATALTLGTAQTQAVPALAYISKNVTYFLNQAITPNTQVSSGSPTGFSIAPALPAGLSFNTSTGAITGTPTAASAQTQYVVSATLNANTVRDTLFITVSAGDPPSAPATISATAGPAVGQATVSWTAPAIPGTNPVTSYKASAISDTTKSCTAPSGTLTCAISGLTNGTAYTFRVRAISNSGAGEWSVASSSVTTFNVPAVPSAPTALDNKNGSATVYWTAPNNGGSAITGYKVVLVSDTSKTCSWTTGALNCTITGLTGMQATFRVRAINAVGSSAYSTASAPVGVTALSGGFVIRMSGASKPFTFILPQSATADEMTMNISDVWGRTVWSKTVVPAKHGRELSWNGTNASGRRVGAGMYIVKLSVVDGGKKVELAEKAVSLKP